MSRTHPIFTPRIWLCYEPTHGVLIGSARRSDRPDASADRCLWSPESIPRGSAVLITTYAGTTDDIVTSGVPLDVATDAATGEQLLETIWHALEPSLRVAALVTQPDKPTGTLLWR